MIHNTESENVIKEVPDFDQQACYRIQVQGRLDESWAERFYGLSLEVRKDEENKYISTLTGSLSDQAALAGLLSSLYDMHLTILTVEMVVK